MSRLVRTHGFSEAGLRSSIDIYRVLFVRTLPRASAPGFRAVTAWIHPQYVNVPLGRRIWERWTR